MINNQLDFLTSSELTILEKHVQLGLPHLKRILTPSELKKIFNSLSVEKKQAAKIGKSLTEIAAKLSLVLNTIVTAVLGSWMGYFGFLGLELSSPKAFFLTIGTAACIGLFIGYQIVVLKKKQMEEAIKNQKLHLFQFEILKKIERKKKEECARLYEELKSVFSPLSLETPLENESLLVRFQDKNSLYELAEKFLILAKAKLKTSEEHLSQECREMYKQIEKELEYNVSVLETKDRWEAILGEEEPLEKRVQEPTLKKLVALSLEKPLSSPSWLPSTGRALLVDLAPTILGGFSSLSVYLGGIPSLLKEFGYERLYAFFSIPSVKVVELILSVLITLYFGFSFLFEKKKAFNRQLAMEKLHKKIVTKEAYLTVLDSTLFHLKKIKRDAGQLEGFFKVVKSISSNFTLMDV